MMKSNCSLIAEINTVLNKTVEYAKTLGESDGEIIIDVKTIGNGQDNFELGDYELTASKSIAQLNVERMNFVRSHVLYAHDMMLLGKKPADMAWNSKIICDQIIMQLSHLEDCSICIGVYCSNEMPNRQIVTYAIRLLESL